MALDTESIAAEIGKITDDLVSAIRAMVGKLDADIVSLEEQLAKKRAQRAEVETVLAKHKPARAAKGTGKPRGPRKALGSGPVPPVGPESGPQQVTTGKNAGRWRNPGSVVSYGTREEAVEAAG